MATETVKDAYNTVLGSIEAREDGMLVLTDTHGKVRAYYDPKTDHTRDASMNILAKGNMLHSVLC
jgi:hypothetical protein